MTTTPLEKADELIQKYLDQYINFPYIDLENDQCIGSGYMTYYSAVRCAIIAVDEIINNNNKMPSLLTQDTMHNTWFWQEVKKELQNKLI